MAPLAAVTDAVLPVEPAHTGDAVVIVAPETATIATVLFPDEVLQPVLLVTVTESITDPDLVAV